MISYYKSSYLIYDREIIKSVESDRLSSLLFFISILPLWKIIFANDCWLLGLIENLWALRRYMLVRSATYASESELFSIKIHIIFHHTQSFKIIFKFHYTVVKVLMTNIHSTRYPYTSSRNRSRLLPYKFLISETFTRLILKKLLFLFCIYTHYYYTS